MTSQSCSPSLRSASRSLLRRWATAAAATHDRTWRVRLRCHSRKDELKRQFGSEYVLMAPELATDGVDLLWDFSRTRAGEGMIEARSGQHVIREIVADYLTYLTLGEDNLPESLRLHTAMPSDVVVNPRHMFGQPMFVTSGARMADVANMIKAGEDSETVAFEHGVTVEDVRTAARVLLGHAA